MRKARHGLELLGFPANTLLRHGRRRIVYGVLLARNARNYLLGMAARPQYLAPTRRVQHASACIATWWVERWLSGRIDSDEFLDRVRAHALTHPLQHGARVVLPQIEAAPEVLPDLP
jgi:hypothetical protein